MHKSSVHPRGFTLIEVMIVVVVVAILAAIAYPSYVNYVIRAERSDAREALLSIQLAQEKWRANNPEYAADLATLGRSSTSGEGYYTLAITASSATGFSAAATRLQAGRDPDCSPMTLTVDRNGETRGPADCW
ncbi:MAG: type IV pilin protein [Halothiobacillaceae bacterium]